MNSDDTNTVIIQGFDRSGSTVITKVLASSDEVVLFMQPFNSGPIRKRMYEIWHADMAQIEDKSFFAGLENKVMNLDYIKSPWFEKHSTSTKYVAGKTHIIKSTINHFTTEWLSHDYPKIDQWAIWRDPMQILASLKRNEFISKWYKGAIDEIIPAVISEPVLKPFVKYIDVLKSDVQKTAFLIAVRSYFLFYHIDDDKLIDYGQFIYSPKKALSHFTTNYELTDINYSLSNESHNLIGENYEKENDHIYLLGAEDRDFAFDIFMPLNNLIKNKFNVD